MNMQKIVNRVFFIVVLFCAIKVDIQAVDLPYVSHTSVKSLDHGIEIKINYKYNNPTSYLIKRADAIDGNYVTIADNVTETTYVDTGLENARAYYYKVYARNEEGLGLKPDMVEGIPSAPRFVWIYVYGRRASINGIDIYDKEGDKLSYYGGYIHDFTNYSSYNNYANRLLNHLGQSFNLGTSHQIETYFCLGLPHNKGVGKVSIHAGASAPTNVEISTSTLGHIDNYAVYYGETDFEKRRTLKEYTIYQSGLKSNSQDSAIELQWAYNEDFIEYTVMRAESPESDFNLLSDGITTLEFKDTTVENAKDYYYKVLGTKENGEKVNLGIVHDIPSKDKYVIVEFYESYDENKLLLNGLQLLDSNNNTINYSVSEIGAFQINYYDDSKNIDSLCGDYFNLFQNIQDGSSSNSCYLSYYLKPGQWVRYALVLEDNTGVNKVNLWAGNDKQPKQVTIYKTYNYNYDVNLMQRRNYNLAYFDQRTIADVNQVTKYEFTQSVPDTPQNIKAIAKDARAKIMWDKVDNGESYNIKRSTSPNGPFTTLAQNILETEYEDTGMTNGIAYYYVVTAVNDGGESANSAEVAITPNPQLPQAPMNLTVIPRDNAIELTWQPIYNADNYQVMRSETEGGPYVSVLESTTNTTFTDTNVVFGKTYYYVVQAKNTTGTSNNSSEVQGVPGQVLPSTPTNIITKVKDKSVHLTWDAANDATSYNLMRSKSESGPYILIHEQLRGISCNDSDVAYGETYYYKILAVNERGESEPTQPIRVHVMDTTEQKVLLSLTMKHGTTKDYILTQSQLADFMKWYQDKTQNIGLPYFTVIGKNNYGVYKAHKSYILFDAILSMDIKEIQDK